MASGSSDREKDKDSRWYFTAEQLANSPSRKCGIDADMELMYRQRGANLIQCMGQRLQVSQLCINTAIVYMHRFYAFHSFTHFHRNGIAAVSLFLAAKVEEQPRKLEHVIKEAHACLKLEAPEPTKESYAEQVKDLVFNENVLLQTLGFDVAIDHPHTHVVKTCHLVKASKDLAQTSYFMASNSLHLTTMCLQYRPTVVACFCIHLACKWSRWEIPQSTERKHWFQYVDKSVTLDLLQKLTDEFLHIFDRCPSRLKSKMKSMSASAQAQQRIEEPQRSLPGTSSSNSQAITSVESSSGQTSSSSHHRSHHSSHPHQHSKMPHAQPIASGAAEQHNSKSNPTAASASSASSTSSGHKSAHAIPSSSNINRQRSDRPVASSSTYVPTANPHATHSSSSGNKNLPSNLHGSTTGRPPSSSSSSSSSTSSQRSSSIHPGESSGYIPRDTTIKNRNVTNAHNHKQNDQRHLGKESSNSNSKSDYKSQSENSKTNAIKSELYVNNKNSSLVNIKQTQQYQQQQIQSTNIQTQQVSSNRNQQLDHSVQKSFSESSFKQTDDLNRTVEPMQICTPPKQNKQSSIFSPDWKDNTSSIVSRNNNNNNNNNNNSSISMKSVDSPTNKKQLFHYDKKTEQQQQKKEKKLDLSTVQIQQQKNQSSDKRIISVKKLFDPGMPTMIPPTTLLEPPIQNKTLSNSVSKRPFSDIALKQEENIDYRDNKIRKIENELNSPLINNELKMISNNSSNSYDMTFNNDSRSSKSFINTVNGIETNPVLVSSLLKEMCTDNKFGSSLNSGNVGATKLPANINLNIEQLSPNVDTIIDINHIEEPLISDIKLADKDEIQRSKSEKKKKKDKHKHKEKEKSKDERKKHKKDKDRHKDREKDMKSPMSESSIEQASSEARIKITIPKEKLNLPAQDLNSSIKIKIAKDRIKSDLSTTHSTNISNQSYLSQDSSTGQTSSLKIKISKDMIENYNSSSSSHTHLSDSSHIHHSGKKKDRDKEREKQKSKSDFKQNLNSNGNNSNPGSSINRSSSASSATNQNKILPPYTSSSNPVHYQQQLQQQQQVQYHQNNMSNSTLSSGGHGRMPDYNKVAMGSNNNYFYPNRANNNSNNISSNNK